MTTPPHPFRKRKRWIAVGVSWLLVAYPLSVGPVNYMDGRGWIPMSFYGVLRTLYGPTDEFIRHDSPGSSLLSAYAIWAYHAAE